MSLHKSCRLPLSRCDPIFALRSRDSTGISPCPYNASDRTDERQTKSSCEESINELHDHTENVQGRTSHFFSQRILLSLNSSVKTANLRSSPFEEADEQIAIYTPTRFAKCLYRSDMKSVAISSSTCW